MTGGAEVGPDPESLRRLISGLRELPPNVRTGVRRELRQVGSDVVAEQQAILSGPLPGRTAAVGQRMRIRRVVKRDGSVHFYRIHQNVYEDGARTARGRGAGRQKFADANGLGLRNSIKGGLKTRIVAGRTRQGIDFVSTARGGSFKFWNKARFRHPVFGSGRWAYQLGQPYFSAPIIAGRDEMLRRAADILTRAEEQA